MTSSESEIPERRGDPRISATSVHAIIVDVEEDGILVPGALVPHDISPGGVRGKWERPLPPETFTLHLEIGDGVETQARMAWQRLLPGGGTIAGVSFLELSEEGRQRIEQYLAALQVPPRRRSPRYPDVLPVEVLHSDTSLTAIASDVSANGLQIATDDVLPAVDGVTLLLPLTWGVPLEVSATIRWRRETPHGGRIAGLEFGPLGGDASAALTAYLDELTS